MRCAALPAALLSAGLLCCEPAAAHSFGQVYNLPVPFWLYAWGATAALLASFLVVGYFMSAGDASGAVAERDVTESRFVRCLLRLHLITLCRWLSVAALGLCIATGLWGSKSPYGNFNMTFFWIVFILGFTYLTAVIGNWYALINPWRVISDAIGRLWPGFVQGRFTYPAGLCHWPALALYAGFIWLELFGGSTPFSLALWLSGYTVFNLLGIGLFGQRAWLGRVEFLGLFMRLVARMAPLSVSESAEGRLRVRLRWPFAGLLGEPARDLSVMVFILFMLSSTAFDGLHETVIWQRLFWEDLYRGLLIDWVGSNPLAAFPAMVELLQVWQSFWLLAWAVVYCAVYWLFIWLTGRVVRGSYSARELALTFAPSLLPIVLVYNISHYYTLIQTQGVKIVTLASDPFGYGWDLFGTGDWLQRTIIPDAGTVWHAQVGLIVAGHIVSVVMAHKQALQLFDVQGRTSVAGGRTPGATDVQGCTSAVRGRKPGATPQRGQALISQLPMLALMVLFTVAGLWILSQPVKAG